MRKYSGGEEKLYINSLCVSGNSIKLLNPINKCYTGSNKNIKFTLDVDELKSQKSHCSRKVNKEQIVRQPLKVNVTEYKNFQVCSKELRQIYETVKVQDFERILNNFYKSGSDAYKVTNKIDEILDKINADDIYEEFFGQYYNKLYDLVEAS